MDLPALFGGVDDIATPILSFTLWEGLKYSSFVAISAWTPSAMRFKRTRGVLPISSVMSFAIFILFSFLLNNYTF
jgi:hypothetical protein